MKTILICFFMLSVVSLGAQTTPPSEIFALRSRGIVDNDFDGDPDGLFQLAEQLLSPSAAVRAIICSHHYKNFYGHSGTTGFAKQKVTQLLNVDEDKGCSRLPRETKRRISQSLSKRQVGYVEYGFHTF